MAKKVLVTGGDGFIGSRTVEALVSRGDEVWVVDARLSQSCPAVAKYCRGNITDQAFMMTVFYNFNPDVVIHLAAQVSVLKSVENPLEDARTNILGTINIVNAALALKVKKLVFASSGGTVYGEPQYIPSDEKHPIKPMAPYALSKFTAEEYIRLSGLDYIILRYGNVYGGLGPDLAGEAGVVAIFARKMKHGVSCIIFGDGNKTRDYIHVKDVVNANLMAVNSDRCGVYNIGTGIETTDLQIFHAVAHHLGYKLEPEFVDFRPGELRRVFLDCNKARHDLQWEATISLKEGLYIL